MLWLKKPKEKVIKVKHKHFFEELGLKLISKDCFSSAIEFSRDRRDYYTLVPALYELGKLLYETGDKNEGIKNIEEALSNSEQYHLLQEKKVKIATFVV